MQFVPVTTKVMSFKLKLGRGVLHLRRWRTFERFVWTKERKRGHLSGKQVDIWAEDFWTFERILEIGVDIWAEHILLIICDLIQLVPLPLAKFSHLKLILLPPAHQRGGGSKILSRIMFNLMKIMKWRICLSIAFAVAVLRAGCCSISF